MFGSGLADDVNCPNNGMAAVRIPSLLLYVRLCGVLGELNSVLPQSYCLIIIQMKD